MMYFTGRMLDWSQVLLVSLTRHPGSVTSTPEASPRSSMLVGGHLRAPPLLTGQYFSMQLCWYVACSSLFCPHRLDELVRGAQMSSKTDRRLYGLRSWGSQELIDSIYAQIGPVRCSPWHLLTFLIPSPIEPLRLVKEQRTALYHPGRRRAGGISAPSHVPP